MKSKYGNSVVFRDGQRFDSKREYARWLVLVQAQNEGRISGLRRQPKFELIPKITEKYVEHMKTKDKERERTVQKAITYTADFAYFKDGKEVVEDVKASEYLLPKEYVLKEKLMRWKHGIIIKRVFKPLESV